MVDGDVDVGQHPQAGILADRREREGTLAGGHGLVIHASVVAIDGLEDKDLRQAARVVERLGEGFGVVQVSTDPLQLARWEDRGAQGEPQVDCLLKCVRPLGQMPEGIEGLLEVLRRRAVRRPEHRLVARLSQTRDRLFPRLGADRVIREALDMLGEPVVAVLLDGFEDPRVELPSSRLEQTRVGDLVRQRVLEGVLDVGEEASLIE